MHEKRYVEDLVDQELAVVAEKSVLAETLAVIGGYEEDRAPMPSYLLPHGEKAGRERVGVGDVGFVPLLIVDEVVAEGPLRLVPGNFPKDVGRQGNFCPAALVMGEVAEVRRRLAPSPLYELLRRMVGTVGWMVVDVDEGGCIVAKGAQPGCALLRQPGSPMEVLGSAIIDMVELRLYTEALTDCRVGGEEPGVIAGLAEAACEAGVIGGIGDLEWPTEVHLRRKPRKDADDRRPGPGRCGVTPLEQG